MQAHKYICIHTCINYMYTCVYIYICTYMYTPMLCYIIVYYNNDDDNLR